MDGNKASLLVTVWERWKVIAHIIGNFQARVLLTILYFVLIPPFGMLVQVLMDPLELRRRPRQTFWLTLARRAAGLSGARKQS